ncbi:MAG: type II toxin-antitoxin system ParD family antitoxin [Byssovorax sp.]
MSAHASTGIDTALILDPQLRARLEKLAEAAGRSASEVVAAVLRQFLDENERDLAAIDAGIEEANAGQLLDYDDVKADVLAQLSARTSKR